MNIETTGFGTLIIVLVMAVVTLATRWGGIFVMSFVPINYRVQLFISAMSGSVLVALLAPLAVAGDNGADWHCSPRQSSCCFLRSLCQRSPQASSQRPCSGSCEFADWRSDVAFLSVIGAYA